MATTSEQCQTSDAVPENKGILWGKSVEQVKDMGIDLADPNPDIPYLLGDLSGAVFLEQVFKFWGDGECEFIPWFYDDASTREGHDRDVTPALAHAEGTRVEVQGKLRTTGTGIVTVAVVSLLLLLLYGSCAWLTLQHVFL